MRDVQLMLRHDEADAGGNQPHDNGQSSHHGLGHARAHRDSPIGVIESRISLAKPPGSVNGVIWLSRSGCWPPFRFTQAIPASGLISPKSVSGS